MKLSMSANIFYDATYKTPYTKMMERIAAQDFEAIDLAFCDFLGENSPFLQDDWERWVINLKATADNLGIVFGQGHAPIYSLFEGSERSAYLDKITKRSMKAAAMLDIPWLVFHTAELPCGYLPDNKEATKDANKGYFENFLKIAQDTGVGIAIENVNDTWLKDGSIIKRYCTNAWEINELVDYFDHPLMGVCLDTGHAQCADIDQAEMIKMFGKRLKTLHIQDNDGFSDQHLAPFQGRIKWEPLMKALRQMDYTGTFNYEVHFFARFMPDKLKDQALMLLHDIGRYLIKIYEESK